MHNSLDIPVKHLVLIGGGHAHVHTLKMLGMDPMKGVAVTLITKDIETPYSGMIPGFVAGHYVREECHVDLAKICSFSGVSLVHAEACRLDRSRKRVYCSDGRPPIRYDVLSIDIGITPKPLPLIFQSSRPTITPVKPIDRFSYRWEIILARVLAAEMAGKPVQLAVVGGGAGGTELCFAMHHRLQQEMIRDGKDVSLLQVTLYNRGPTLISQHNKGVQNIINRIAAEKGIIIQLNTEIVSVEMKADSSSTDHLADYLVSADGRKFIFDEAIWCTDASVQSWIKETGLETTEEGFICVGATLESCNSPGIFACGDVAHLVESPRPKAGVFAVRAGPPLTANLRRKLLNQPLETWTPQDQFLGIIGTGGAYAVASKGPLGIEGEFVWKLKDKIDRTWMAVYNDLPDKEQMMEEKKKKKQLEAPSADGEEFSPVARTMGEDTLRVLTESKMRCGGCGSKVGSQVLSRALSRVKSMVHRRDEVICGIGQERSGQDDAALLRPPAPPAYMVHTIDYFRSFVSDPFLFGQIAANHALSDVYAMNGEPVSALALVVLPYGPEEMVEDNLVQMLAGCLDVLRREGCALVGGHTSEGSDRALGLAVHGVVHPTAALRKAIYARDVAAQEMVLVLTKPLGTGTIMAAHMRARAKGGWVLAAHRSMLVSNREAAGVLHRFDCVACTDVTGFGLLGHLLEMIQGGEESQEDAQEAQAEAQEGAHDEGGLKEGSRALRTSVNIRLGSIPVLPGALECVHELGIMSSLHPQNMRCVRVVQNPQLGRTCRSYPLLFDPQVTMPFHPLLVLLRHNTRARKQTVHYTSTKHPIVLFASLISVFLTFLYLFGVVVGLPLLLPADRPQEGSSQSSPPAPQRTSSRH